MDFAVPTSIEFLLLRVFMVDRYIDVYRVSRGILPFFKPQFCILGTIYFHDSYVSTSINYR